MPTEGSGDMGDEERTWAPPIEAITGSAGHLEGRRLTGPQQGFGQLWQKTYRVFVPDHEPRAVIATWKANYGDFWPSVNKFNAPVAGIKPGEVGSIDSMQVLSTGVVVIYADDTSFAFMTPEGHPFAGWITFSAIPEGGGSVAQVQLLIRASDPLWDLGFVFGAGKGEDWMWRHTLKALATHLGSDAKPTQEIVKVDRKRLWQNSGNWKRNAIFRKSRR
jgi:hypothetical protein